MGAILSIHSEIGAGATVAEGSVVTMRQIISPDVVVAGSPAKVLHQVKDENSRANSFRNKIYEDLAKEYIRDGMQRIDPSRKSE